MPQNLLEQLRNYTVVVADTGDIEAMEKFRPQDATTNPSLITAAAQMPQYQPIVDGVLMDARKELGEGASDEAVANLAFQRLAIAFGQEDTGHRAGTRLNGSGRAAFLRHRGDHRSGSQDHCAVRPRGHRPRTHPDQDRVNLGGHSRRRSAGEGRHPLQPDAAVRAASGHCGCRCGRHAGFAVRGPNPRLVQEGHGQGLPRAPTIPASCP